MQQRLDMAGAATRNGGTSSRHTGETARAVEAATSLEAAQAAADVQA